MKKLRLSLIALTLLTAGFAHADDSDIFSYAIEPNVLILLDSSGSMTDYIESNPYDPEFTYSGSYTSETVYNRVRRRGGRRGRRGGGRVSYNYYASSVSNVPSYNARRGLGSVGYWSGRIYGSQVNLFTGNYLNYLQSGGPTYEQKWTIAKRVVNSLVTNTEGVRFGVMKFRSHGAEMVSPIGTTAAQIVTSVTNLPTPSGGTPLGDMMYDAGRYFKGNYGGYADPIQYECQPNFIILISDGMENSTYRYVVDEAALRFTQDHASNIPGLQNISVHTIGFAIDDSQELVANSTLRTAATNGNGSFHSTEDQADLEAALLDVIGQVLSGVYSFAAPLIPTTSTTGSDKLFLGAFQSDPFERNWQGFLKAYQRGADGNVPTDSSGNPLASSLLWDAGAVLASRSSGTRKIYTHLNGSRQEFVTSNGSINTTVLDVSSSADRDKVINFVRGKDALDEDGDTNTSEDRSFKLGDIFHSSPVLISAPPLALNDASYKAFKYAQANRTPIIVAGANDGQIHAFQTSDGAELWSFIPPSQLSRLKYMIEDGDHLFYVDSSPIASDVKLGGAWKTVVMIGERRGGESYHLLDVTDTTSPQLLWSFTDALLGETWSEPRISAIKMGDGTTKYVAVIGGGYDTELNNDTGKAVLAIDLETGNKIWEYKNNSNSDDRRFMNFSFAASPAVVDIDGDAHADYLYIGDVGGQLWKFDLTNAATLSSGMINNWSGKRLFAADSTQANPPAAGEYYPAQAIYSSPILAYYNNDLWVYFGTGDRNHPNNLSTVNRFYGIKDDQDMTNGQALTESSLVDNTSTENVVTQGWYIRMAAGEKIVADAEVFNDAVLFTSFTPSSTIVCDGVGGPAKLYAVQMGTGYGAVAWGTGNKASNPDSSTQRSTPTGTGLPSKPVVTLTESGGALTSSIVVGTTSSQLQANPIASPGLKRMLYWREVY